MKINNKIYYHIATNGHFKVGDKLHFENELNGQSRIFDFDFTNNGTPLYKLAFDSSKKGIFKDKKLMFELSKALSNYDLFMRETALEEVRKEKFPDFPSRFHCMFLTETKEDMLRAFNKYKTMKNSNKYFKTLSIRNKNDTYQALAVKLNGTAFFVKDCSISREGVSYNEYKKKAVEFWSQNQKSKNKTKEIIFIGDAEIVEVIDEVK